MRGAFGPSVGSNAGGKDAALSSTGFVNSFVVDEVVLEQVLAKGENDHAAKKGTS
tara:strand:+ start:880 stop:1044 length:165 start_codon:yes stop_codon:yes gene_type:complete